MAQVILRQKAKSQLAKILEYAYQEYGQTTLNPLEIEQKHPYNQRK